MVDFEKIKQKMIKGLDHELAGTDNPNKEFRDASLSRGYLTAVSNMAEALRESGEPLYETLGREISGFAETYRSASKKG